MTDQVQAYLQICEDYRVEEGGKPMFIGMLSPIFFVKPNPGVADQLTVVSVVLVPHAVTEVDVRLVVTISNPDAEDETQSFRMTLRPESDLVPDEPWINYLPLQLPISEWRDGTLVRCDLTAGD